MHTQNQDESALWFIFFNNQIVLEKRVGKLSIPSGSQPPFIHETHLRYTVGKWGETICYALSLAEALEETTDYLMKDLRESHADLQPEQFQMAGKASEILYWHRTSRFCPACGTPMEQFTDIMKRCPNCKHEMYPTVSAAVLVLIRKKESILLVHAHNFKKPFKSLVAGFLETGESLEECVKREVLEETGLEIGNITYFGSQPWPFPNNIMIGFTADYVKGEITLQEEELSSGDFYTKDHLPELPRNISLSRKMIDWWIKEEEKKVRL